MPEPLFRRYVFDHFTLDLSRACLLAGEKEVRLRPKSFEALIYLLENRGRLVTKEELIGFLWPDSFVTDDSLVKCMSDVRRALEDESHRYVTTVPRKGYIFDAEVIEQSTSPTELLETEELDAVSIMIEEESGEAPVVPAGDERGATGVTQALAHRRWFSPPMAFLAAGAALALAAFAYFLANPGKPLESVAIMPFVNVGRSPEVDYLADGITEHVIGNLSQLSGLKVMSRNSVFRYKGREIDPRVLGRELGVQAVLLGRLELRGDDLAIGLELVDARDNRQIWGKRFNRRLSDILDVEAEISRNVTENLRLRLTGEEHQLLARRHTRNPQAHQLYLRGRYHWDKWTRRDAPRSIEYFEQAIQLDPHYALAYSGLADAYSALNGLGGAPPNEVMPKAKAAAARALELDETLAEAHTSMGLIKHFYDWDFAEGDRYFQRAIALKPNSATAHHLYGKNLPDTLRFEEALAQLKRALELDPHSVGINKDLGEILYYTRRYDQAIAQLHATLELEPNYSMAYYWLARSHEAKGNQDQAVANYLEGMSLRGADPQQVEELRGSYDARGWKGYWEKRRDQLMNAGRQTYQEPFFLVSVHARLNDKERVFEWLEKSFESRSAWIPTISYDPLLDPVRSDPRFESLLRRRSGIVR